MTKYFKWYIFLFCERITKIVRINITWNAQMSGDLKKCSKHIGVQNTFVHITIRQANPTIGDINCDFQPLHFMNRICILAVDEYIHQVDRAIDMVYKTTFMSDNCCFVYLFQGSTFHVRIWRI